MHSRAYFRGKCNFIYKTASISSLCLFAIMFERYVIRRCLTAHLPLAPAARMNQHLVRPLSYNDSTVQQARLLLRFSSSIIQILLALRANFRGISESREQLNSAILAAQIVTNQVTGESMRV